VTLRYIDFDSLIGLKVIFKKLIIVFISLALIGCFGGGSSNAISSSSASSNSSFLNSGTGVAYSSSNAENMAVTTELDYFNASSASSTQNPLEVINSHKAYGYGLTGSGEIIAIIDSGFNVNHNELNSKAITQYGAQTLATGVNATADHGLIVSSVAVGEDDGTGMQGVAPAASLHISSYNQSNGNTYYPSHWANATDNASSAVAQNNSWGINYQIDDLKSDITSNSWTNIHGISQKFNSSGFTSNEAAANSYITALDNFQNHGVIVYALSNSTSYTDADFQAALPELFSNLEEAWITAVNIEITGSAGNETYTRKSAPCGSTGRYCLGADGYQIVGAAYHSSNTSSYWSGVSGTSFVAPQISGAVAILAEAFPNHTPSQLADRLLASANNSFFSHDAAVTFGNGISHGYDDEFGHGILDIYAALNPITSSSYTRIYTGKSTEVGDEYQLGNSKFLTTSSLGDSLQKGLTGVNSYTYDDLGGGFKYDMSYHVDLATNNDSKINLSEELDNLSDSLNNSIQHFLPTNSYNVLSIGESPLPVMDFFDIESASTSFESFIPPYLSINENSLGVSSSVNLAKASLLFSATVPINLNNMQKSGHQKNLIGSLQYGDSSNHSVTIMAGLTEEEDSLLGSFGANAFSLSGSRAITSFTAIKAQKKIFDNILLNGFASIANTNMTSPTNSLIDSANGVKSSSVGFTANMNNLSSDDQLSLFINQPNRVEGGSIAIKVASLADSKNNVNQTIKDINLSSSSRQVNYGISYRKDVNENLAFSLKHLITNNLNHRENSNQISSSYIGLNYKDLMLGFATNLHDSSIEAELSYEIIL
jgi:subtilase-type serine protease